MNDRELLELAAKAAGVSHVDYSGVDYDGSLGLIMVDSNGRHVAAWSPLEDDGDAFRLAIKLGICIQFISECDTAQAYQERAETAEPYNIHISAMGNIELRRIIVQAAAEIGKAMP